MIFAKLNRYFTGVSFSIQLTQTSAIQLFASNKF